MKPVVLVLALLRGAPMFGADVVMASGALQKCLGITPGSDRMAKGPATQSYCQQLPGASLYAQAGDRFRAGDHAGAEQIVARAAEAGNAVAQLRLALMYDQGDGVKRSAQSAFIWYNRAAAQGEPESQNQMGLFYELGEGVAENWDLAARFFQASAVQGWTKGQFSFARAYQFGIGVPQDRRFGAELMGGDPRGIAFHNSAQRAMWLMGQRNRVNKQETEVFRQIRQREYDDCRRAGRDNCGSGRF